MQITASLCELFVLVVALLWHGCRMIEIIFNAVAHSSKREVRLRHRTPSVPIMPIPKRHQRSHNIGDGNFVQTRPGRNFLAAARLLTQP